MSNSIAYIVVNYLRSIAIVSFVKCIEGEMKQNKLKRRIENKNF